MLAHASCVGVRAYLFRRRQKLGCGPGLGTRPRPPRCSARVTRPPRINTVPRVLGAASLASTSYLAASMMCGAPSAAKPATAETQKLVDAVRLGCEARSWGPERDLLGPGTRDPAAGAQATLCHSALFRTPEFEVFSKVKRSALRPTPCLGFPAARCQPDPGRAPARCRTRCPGPDPSLQGQGVGQRSGRPPP